MASGWDDRVLERRGERLYGFGPHETVGRSSHSLLQTKFPIEFAELRSQLRIERHWSGELRHVCKDGREVIVEEPDRRDRVETPRLALRIWTDA
jgi:PAS domain-containing protein